MPSSFLPLLDGARSIIFIIILGKTTKAIATGKGKIIATDIVEIMGKPSPVTPCNIAPSISNATTKISIAQLSMVLLLYLCSNKVPFYII